MAESIVLPVMNMVQAAVLAEPAAVEGEDAASDFTIEEVEVDPLLIDAVPLDISAVEQPVQDPLQMLIEDLSGITGALRPVPPPSPSPKGEVAGDAILPDAKVALPDAGVRIAVAVPADPPPAPAIQADPAALQIDSLPADPLPSSAPAARDAASPQAPAVLPPSRIPTALVARQVADAVVTAREDRVEVALAPEELGRIRMVMTGPDHSPHVVIWAERPEVLDQLRRNASFLQDCFGDAGMADASFEFQGDGGTGSGGRQPLPDAVRHGFDATEPALIPLAWTPMAIPARLDIRI
mgnify:CR=1 FL=1